MPVKPGDILRDKLRIDAFTGRGGMGQVFAATDLDTRQQVAVKVVSRLFVDETLMLRLHREAVAAQRIRSDYVPRVFEVNDTGDGETYLVMERLMGEPLSARIRSQGALPWSEVARLGEEILRGVIDAHQAGIIHRDLKPSNVFLALKTGRVRAMVLDFGVCKMDGVDTERLTGTGESIGTVAYMAPEQIRGAAKVDERADLYAFGVIIFEMLAGRLPHEGPSQMAILASKLEKEAAPLRDCVRSAIPEALDSMINRSLSRDPNGRQSSAQEILREWRSLARAEGFIAASVPPPAPGSSKKSIPPPGAGSKIPPPPGGIARHSRDSEPPTEVSKPDVGPEVRAVLGAHGMSSDDELDMEETHDQLADKSPYGPGSHPSLHPSLFPPPSHPTDVPVAAAAPAGVPGAGARFMIMGSVAAVAIGACVAAFAFSRPDHPHHVVAVAPPSAASALPAPIESSVATTTTAALESTTPAALPNAPPAADSVADDVELPADAPATNEHASSSEHPPQRHRSLPPALRSRVATPKPPPAESTPTITSQPRY